MPELLLSVNGTPVRVPAGTSVLAALQNAGAGVLRRSLSGEGRGALCGMGVCYECRATVDGRLVRTCLTPVRAGMQVDLSGGPDVG